MIKRRRIDTNELQVQSGEKNRTSTAFRVSSQDKGPEQYASFCYYRMERMRAIIVPEALAKAAGVELVDRVSHMPVDKRCMIFGSLYKHMDKRPSILDDLAPNRARSKKKAAAAAAMPVAQSLSTHLIGGELTSANDILWLEDEFGRVLLSPDPEFPDGLAVERLVSGISLCAVGKLTEIGTFLVERVIWRPPAALACRLMSLFLFLHLEFSSHRSHAFSLTARSTSLRLFRFRTQLWP